MDDLELIQYPKRILRNFISALLMLEDLYIFANPFLTIILIGRFMVDRDIGKNN